MTNTILRRASLILCLWAAPLWALDLPLPQNATLSAESRGAGARYALPTGPWTAEGGVPVQVIEGQVTRRAWQIPGSTATPTDILMPLRAALEAAGYTVRLDCAARRCGGFDFRFATDVIPAPDMYVDLTDYRFLSASGPEGDGVSVLVSRSAAAGFVQIIEARPGGAPAPERPATTLVRSESPADADATIAALEANGAVILQGVDFASGSAALEPGPVAELDALADYLAQNADRRLLFVGHTDAVGSLAANQALSRRRAEAAADYLRQAGADPARIAAEGAGYLAPIASNLSEEGRRANRRVEAVLLPFE